MWNTPNFELIKNDVILFPIFFLVIENAGVKRDKREREREGQRREKEK